MAVSSRSKLRDSIVELFEGPAEPEPPRRITISPTPELFARVARLADKLGQSWNATACLLLDAAVDEALDLVYNDLQVHVGKAQGLSAEQMEDFNALDREQQKEVLAAMGEWSEKPDADNVAFTHPLLREAQLRDEQVRQVVGKGANL